MVTVEEKRSSIFKQCWQENKILPIRNMKTRTPEQLGAAIRARRKQLKVTQKDLAMTCGTGLRFTIDLENGKGPW